jgi:hypothetical protein
MRSRRLVVALVAAALGVLVGALAPAWVVALVAVAAAIAAAALRVRAVEGGGEASRGPLGPLPLAVFAGAAGLTGLVVALGPGWGVAAAIALVVAFILLGGELS